MRGNDLFVPGYYGEAIFGVFSSRAFSAVMAQYRGVTADQDQACPWLRVLGSDRGPGSPLSATHTLDSASASQLHFQPIG